MSKLKPYPKYKDSGVEWLGEIPIPWEAKSLLSVGNIKKVTGEIDRKLLSVYLYKGVIPFSDIDEKRTNVTSKDLSKYQSVDKGDFVLNNQQAWRGSVGISFDKGIISPAYLIVSLDKDLDPQYANYMFREQSLVSQYVIYSKGVGSIQRNLYWNDLKRIVIYLPPIDDQERISIYLRKKEEEMDKYIEKLDKKMSLLKEYRQKIISQAVTCGLDDEGKLREKPEWKEGDPIPEGWKGSSVEWLGLIPEGWEVGKLKYGLAKNQSGEWGSPPKNDGEDVVCYRVADFDFNRGELKENNLTRRSINRDQYKNKILRKGDLIIEKSGGGDKTPVGRVVRYDKGDEATSSNFTQIVTPGEMYLSKFLLYVLQSFYFTKFIKIYIKQTTGIQNLDLYSYFHNQIPCPTRSEQTKIISFLDQNSQKIEQKILSIQNELNFIREYKQSLISKVVTGKIDVRSSNIS